MVATANEPTFCNHCGGREDANGRFADRFEDGARRAARAIEAKPGERNPTVAALLSFVIPGLGQVYNGEAMKGVLLFFTSIFLVPWVIAVIDAYYVARLMNLEEQVAQRS